jgi:hypothetical protein
MAMERMCLKKERDYQFRAGGEKTTKAQRQKETKKRKEFFVPLCSSLYLIAVIDVVNDSAGSSDGMTYLFRGLSGVLIARAYRARLHSPIRFPDLIRSRMGMYYKLLRA